MDVAVARRDDARSDGAAEAERVADGDDPFAQAQLLRLAELDCRERLVRLYSQARAVGLLILADELGLEPRAVVENDRDLIRLGDHVIVGHNDAGRVDNEARAERVDTARAALAVLRIAWCATPVKEVSEQLVQLRIVRQLRHRAIARLHLL